MNALVDGNVPVRARHVLLNVQAALTCVAFLLNLVISFVDIAGGGGFTSVMSLVATLLSFAAIVGYCMGGYRTHEVRLFRIAVWSVAAMFFFKSLFRSLTVLDAGVLVAGFGLALIFNEKLARPKTALAVIVALVCVLVIGAIAATLRPLTGGAANLVTILARLIPWTHVAIVCTLAIAYSAGRQGLSSAARRLY